MRFLNTTSITLFVLLHLSMHLQAYTPVDHFTVSCGTTRKSSDGERTWTGDEDTTYLSRPDGTVSAKATTQARSANQVPFTTARLSRSQFNYSFPVTAGPKFLRLFFYPANYPSFSRNDASFTFQSNEFTFLNSFNASLNADEENTETIFREYVVHVNDGEMLNLSFTPQPNSYAFVNGIEILSMPSNLYYTSANEMGLIFVDPSSALEMEYRINVGGKEISARNDTGLFRVWAGHDENYLMTQNLEDNQPLGYGGRNITVNPDYVAPKELYRTARVMGINTSLNKSLKLTWEFPVSGCCYMVRLHFGELGPNVNDIDERKFFINIGNESNIVMRWNHKKKGVAVHKDFVVLSDMNDAQKKINLSLQIFPYESDNHTKHSDPLLSGLEIFKISKPQHIVTRGKSNKQPWEDKTEISDFIAFVAAGVISIFYVVFLIYMWKISDPISFSTTNSTNVHNSWQKSNHYRCFSLVEIKAATNNFDDAFIVGIGGFGHVYKGYINGGSTTVAIKRLKPGSKQGAHEFINEIEMLSQLRHLHLATLVGYCNDNTEMIIVYDFMSHGNLRDHLYNSDNPPLSWKQRLQICIGTARGLHYLHTGTKHMIIHHDVKSTNILLDDKWVAKVSDFGLSSIGPTGISKAHIGTVVKGSFGYLDPEYCNRQRLTEKSDVYSFGVVLFEILCARPPLIHTAQIEQVSLANWVRHCYQCETMAQIVDPTLKGSIAPACLRKFCEIGMSCLLEDGMQRPSMNDVILGLEFALQLQESME